MLLQTEPSKIVVVNARVRNAGVGGEVSIGYLGGGWMDLEEREASNNLV